MNSGQGLHVAAQNVLRYCSIVVYYMKTLPNKAPSTTRPLSKCLGCGDESTVTC
jgi:hypothetical protein